MGFRPTIFNQNKEKIMKKILYKILGLLAILALIIAFLSIQSANIMPKITPKTCLKHPLKLAN
jgi:hypothetical protein